MNQDIFLSTKNVTFTDADSKAAVKIQEMIREARSHMPDQFYTGNITFIQFITSCTVTKQEKPGFSNNLKQFPKDVCTIYMLIVLKMKIS